MSLWVSDVYVIVLLKVTVTAVQTPSPRTRSPSPDKGVLLMMSLAASVVQSSSPLHDDGMFFSPSRK